MIVIRENWLSCHRKRVHPRKERERLPHHGDEGIFVQEPEGWGLPDTQEFIILLLHVQRYLARCAYRWSPTMKKAPPSWQGFVRLGCICCTGVSRVCLKSFSHTLYASRPLVFLLRALRVSTPDLAGAHQAFSNHLCGITLHTTPVRIYDKNTTIAM